MNVGKPNVIDATYRFNPTSKAGVHRQTGMREQFYNTSNNSIIHLKFQNDKVVALSLLKEVRLTIARVCPNVH